MAVTLRRHLLHTISMPLLAKTMIFCQAWHGTAIYLALSQVPSILTPSITLLFFDIHSTPLILYLSSSIHSPSTSTYTSTSGLLSNSANYAATPTHIQPTEETAVDRRIHHFCTLLKVNDKDPGSVQARLPRPIINQYTDPFFVLLLYNKDLHLQP